MKNETIMHSGLYGIGERMNGKREIKLRVKFPSRKAAKRFAREQFGKRGFAVPL